MKAKTLKYPSLPYVTGNNKDRVFTKHWANLPLHLNRNEMALLSFITFQAKADNTFRYSVKLIKKYIAAVKYANEEYNPEERKIRMPNELTVNSNYVKFFFESAVENGWILNTNVKGEYMVNPMLTYVGKYVTQEQYQLLCLNYKVRPADVVEGFKGIVNPKIKQKKNSHIYWP